MRHKWNKDLFVTDNARQYRHRDVRKYLEEHDGMTIPYLLTVTPKLSAVEIIWKDAKYRIATSEHYETLEDLHMWCPNISERAQSGLTSTNFYPVAYAVKFSMSVTLDWKGTETFT